LLRYSPRFYRKKIQKQKTKSKFQNQKFSKSKNFKIQKIFKKYYTTYCQVNLKNKYFSATTKGASQAQKGKAQERTTGSKAEYVGLVMVLPSCSAKFLPDHI
jgi:hypothetical protein